MIHMMSKYIEVFLHQKNKLKSCNGSPRPSVRHSLLDDRHLSIQTVWSHAPERRAKSGGFIVFWGALLGLHGLGDPKWLWVAGLSDCGAHITSWTTWSELTSTPMGCNQDASRPEAISGKRTVASQCSHLACPIAYSRETLIGFCEPSLGARK